MQAKFNVRAAPLRDLIRIEMGGFFSAADVEAFCEARRAAHAKLTCGANQHVTLNDVRELKIQSQETVSAFQTLLAAPAYRSRLLAFVVSPTLARSQLSRALSGRDAKTFPSIAEAEHWLFAQEDAAHVL
jgi:hypothetical protein